jgi:hypothetical protein
MMTDIKDMSITQESVNDFFSEIDTQALADSLRMSRKNTAVGVKNDCEYCQEPYKKMWLFDGLLYLQIEHADGLHYLNVMTNGGSEDVGFLYNLCASQEIHFCPMCGEKFEEEE